MRHILLTGGAGQVGGALRRLAWPADVVLHAPPRAELDITDAASVAAAFARAPFAAVVNPAAYTAVDRAESEVGAAFRVNALAPALLADAARAAAIPLIHLSTDYVFDGSRPGRYREDDPVAPIGIYGASKLAGEYAVLQGSPRGTVLRTAWVLSATGSNFLKTMLRVGAERPVLTVVADQIGCPTGADDLARAIQTIALRQIAEPDAPCGIYNFVNGGEASWHDLACAIFAEAAAYGGPRPTVETVTTDRYPTAARRPLNSRLSTERIAMDYGIRPRDWRAAVAEIVAQVYKGSEGSAS